MNIDNLVERIAKYMVGNLGSNAQSPVTRFVLGAAASESGRKMIAAKIAPLVAPITDAQGEIDAAVLKDMLKSGMKSAVKMPILGGLVTLDERDVEVFCEGL